MTGAGRDECAGMGMPRVKERVLPFEMDSAMVNSLGGGIGISLSSTLIAPRQQIIPATSML